ncbi:hypothetical protein [Lacipirellula sp.]|uniref:hypothetical protein n=1 Tax=Lacipirellula sp. TaxID=2691419 RepID=UPI003D13DCED
MANSGSKFSTDYLLNEQMYSALLALPGVLTALLGAHKVVAMYGWAAKIHPSLAWQRMDDHTDRLQYLIEDSIDQRIIVPGQSDFYFEVPEKRLAVMFCHESDIHLDGSDDELLKRFMASDPFAQMRWRTQAEVEKMMVQKD